MIYPVYWWQSRTNNMNSTIWDHAEQLIDWVNDALGPDTVILRDGDFAISHKGGREQVFYTFGAIAVGDRYLKRGEPLPTVEQALAQFNSDSDDW